MTAFEERRTRRTTAAPTRRRSTSCSSTSTSAGPATASSSAASSARHVRALNWIDEYADLMGNGYVWYKPLNEETGLENQCWKDRGTRSPTGTAGCRASPGRPPSLQGYAYDAKVCARLARDIWKDTELADRLEKEAADLKRSSTATTGSRTAAITRRARPGRQPGRFARLEQRPPPLERHRREVEGEVGRREPDGPRLFSAGRATLAEGEGRYNPIGYHVGTVWPFDNSFIAGGSQLRLQGRGGGDRGGDPRRGRVLRRPAARGVRRLRALGDEVPGAVSRPRSPQAWSTGTPLLLLRTMLGLEPLGDHLVVDPALPTGSECSRCSRSPDAGADAFARGIRVEGSSSAQLGPQTNGKAQTRAGARAR